MDSCRSTTITVARSTRTAVARPAQHDVPPRRDGDGDNGSGQSLGCGRFDEDECVLSMITQVGSSESNDDSFALGMLLSSTCEGRVLHYLRRMRCVRCRSASSVGSFTVVLLSLSFLRVPYKARVRLFWVFSLFSLSGLISLSPIMLRWGFVPSGGNGVHHRVWLRVDLL
jgi:hypothetical protein